MIDNVSNSTPLLAPQPKDDPAKVKDAAQQFESLLLAQILKAMHQDDGGWLGTGEDQSAASAMELAQEQFAQALSKSGGLGLADIVTNGLER